MAEALDSLDEGDLRALIVMSIDAVRQQMTEYKDKAATDESSMLKLQKEKRELLRQREEQDQRIAAAEAHAKALLEEFKNVAPEPPVPTDAWQLWVREPAREAFNVQTDAYRGQ
ncbi:unnamed protein product [Symbiodinium natans]|uniref:Uncharacterized protein n=1 Tax=Symbiodinium natans TaxID=878477 RepID=A0A812LC54_9DINO|nr:unnamed protein product [Symbiodinium natans]